ncbi:MAG: hypothetical protein AB4372_26545 [Xenococcus sp. (in: cyanobacteria)]
MKSIISVFFSLPLIVVNTLTARADYIHQTLAEYSGTIMEFRIQNNQIKVILEIDEEDKPAFSNLLEANNNSVLKTNFLQTINQQPITGKIKTIETRQRTSRVNIDSLPNTDLMGRAINIPQVSPYVTYVEIIYPLKNQPSQLIVSPPLADNEKYPDIDIGFITFHEQIPVTNYWYLSQPEILNLNWSDPWYSRFENRNLTRPHPSSLLSYIYIEPYEVRHEILIRIRDLADFIDLDFTKIKSFNTEDLASIEKQAINYFYQQPQMTIDGTLVNAIANRVSFLEVDRRGVFQVVKSPQELKLNSAIIGIELIYPVANFPNNVSVIWNMFNEEITTIPTITTDPAGPFPYNITSDDRVLEWQNSLTKYVIPEVEYLPVSRQFYLPLGLFICVGLSSASLIIIIKNNQTTKLKNKSYYAIPIFLLFIGISTHPLSKIQLGKPQFILAQVSETEAQVIFNHLLKNIYRAFDFREESDIYDKLAISLEGDLLTDVYLQTRKSMEIENQGGAVATVQNIEVTEVEKASSRLQDTISFRTKWIASGTLEHWGHSHNRQNQYDAVVTISPVNDVWKITDIELLEETRIE